MDRGVQVNLPRPVDGMLISRRPCHQLHAVTIIYMANMGQIVSIDAVLPLNLFSSAKNISPTRWGQAGPCMYID
jgi:hypothetical protein